jgi:tetratricopeptide (TPR) repeat protein
VSNFVSLACSLALLLFGAALARADARAEEGSEYDRAIRAAVSEYEAGSWHEARALFRRAHELEPSARTLRGLGLTAFELRRYVDAMAELEAALTDARKPLTPEQRDQIVPLLGRIRQYISVFDVSLVPADAELLVDGVLVHLEAGRLSLDPGEHTVVARAQGHEESRTVLRAEAGTERDLTIVLEPSAPPEREPGLAEGEPDPQGDETPAPALAAREPPQPSAAPARPRRVWTWVLAGASLATSLVGAGLHAGAFRKAERFRDCKADPEREDCGPLKTSGEALFAGAIGTYVGGALLLGGAVTAFFMEGRGTERPGRAALLVGPTSVRLSARF